VLKKKSVTNELVERYYDFTIVLTGVGADADEAWKDAIESFTQDPGEYVIVKEVKRHE